MTEHYSAEVLDNLSREGAQALADRLNDYWRAEGATKAQHWIEPVQHRGRKKTGDAHKEAVTMWVVRSNLVNGLPPR